MKIEIATMAAMAALAALPASADEPQEGRQPPGRDRSRASMPMKPDFAKALSISPEKAAQVEAILARQREEMRKIHERSRAELAKVLTPEQLAKVEEMRPRPPRPSGADSPPR